MSLFAINLLLAGAWCGLLGALTLPGLGVGFLVGYAALWAAQPLYGGAAYCTRLPRILWLIVYFFKELFVSSCKVAAAVLSFRRSYRPGIVALPLDCSSDLERLAVANLITLTPGTLSLDFSDDNQTLFVHGMFVEDADAVRAELQEGMQRQVTRALR